MEYNLLRTIEAQIGYPGTSSAFPQLTPFPANDFVNPGLGQIGSILSMLLFTQTVTAVLKLRKKWI